MNSSESETGLRERLFEIRGIPPEKSREFSKSLIRISGFMECKQVDDRTMVTIRTPERVMNKLLNRLSSMASHVGGHVDVRVVS